MSELRVDGAWVAAATGGTIAGGDATREFAGLSIDTRTLQPGDLFVAIRGERFDGAAFAPSAIAAGAAGVLVPRGWAREGPRPEPRGPVVIEVDDTVAALQAIGHRARVESGSKVVAITGSAGKTTTKEMTAEFLATRYRVLRNRGNFNNHIGLPLSLVELRQRPDIAVVELGMNHAGEISTLVRIAEPEVRVWTNVGEAHLGFFASVDAIADAKAEIFEGATAATVLVANADDDRIVARLPRFAGRVVTFGTGRPADVTAGDIVDRGIEGTTATLRTPRGSAALALPLAGRANLANVLAAAATALEFDVPLDAIVARARALVPAARRGEVIRLGSGVVVIDDSYNANPTATRRALELLAVGRAGRRVAVLGEMLELGERTVELHEAVGRAAAAAGVGLLVTVGGAPAESLGAAAVGAGLAPAAVRHCPDSEEAAAVVARLLQPGDVVLVKGSRGVRTDVVVDRLRAELG
jgi:UDP-N-acetylmuramoyl-tripeptide--D-alanyl-D-alanine ligase